MIKKLVLLLIKIYQKTISPDHGSTPLAASGIFSFWHADSTCRFYPTCSEYASQSIGKFGIKKGGSMAVHRILRCHPFSAGGYDPVK